MFRGEPTQELFGTADKDHLVTDELPSAIALFEEALDPLPDAPLPFVELRIVPQTKPGAELHPEPGILDGIFDS